MPKKSTHPRILFVTPQAAFMPEVRGSRSNFIGANTGDFADFPAELISHLFDQGADVHLAQPDYRNIFEISLRQEKSGASVKLPSDRVHLAEDRTLFYSKPLRSNSARENLKISLAFQREIINQIIPRVQPDLIHCGDWMTGLIPAAARKVEIPCLFTVHKFDSARSILADVEDIGIDAAGFWQNLFYDRYPGSYEQTRDTNPLDLLLSGILAASHVNTAGPVPMPNTAAGQGDFIESPLGQLLAQKRQAGCAWEFTGSLSPDINPTGSKKPSRRSRPSDHQPGRQNSDGAKRQSIPPPDNRTTAKCYIELYQTILQRPLVTSQKIKVWPIPKNSDINISGIRAMPYRKAPRIKSYAHTNKRIATVAMPAV